MESRQGRDKARAAWMRATDVLTGLAMATSSEKDRVWGA